MIAQLLLSLLPLVPARVPGQDAVAAGFDPVAGRLFSAQSAYAGGELGTAHDLLREALAEAPGEPEVRLWLARVLNDLGDGAAAEEVLNPALIALPGSPRLLTESARALTLLGERELAENVFRQALAAYPRSGPARLALATLQLEGGRAAEAEATLLPLLEQAPEEPAVVVLMGRVLAARGQRDDAAALLRSRLTPERGDLSIRLALSKLLLDGGESEAAWEVLAPVTASVREVDALLFVARVGLRADRPLAALSALGAALLEDPTNAEVLAELARTLESADLAERIAARRIEAHPEDVESWRGVLEAHLAAGRLDELFAAWTQVPEELRADPRLAVVHASASRRAGRTAEARAALQHIADETDDPRAWYELGLLEYAADASEAAAAAFARGAAGPWAADAHFNRGVCLDRLGRHREAISAYEAAISARSEFAAAWKQIGDDHRYRLGEPEKAREAYLRFLELGGDSPEVRRWLEDGR